MNTTPSPQFRVDQSQQLQNDIDAENEMSETTSMRLQTAMDRKSKLEETLSNVMRKTSDTDDAITQNLK